VSDPDIFWLGLAAAGILFLLLIYSMVNRNSKNKKLVLPSPPESRTEHVPQANVTKVLPVGMLIAKTGANRGLVFSVDPSGVKIGRDRDKNQIVIDDPIISREHAWVGLDDGMIIVRDENSSNGTYINSLDSPRIISQELKDGDVIFIGKKGSESFKFKTG
jgi:pSer/pThr/pTyr-binding forkhead associated (FHA) protein